jgi:hypothetical protein
MILYEKSSRYLKIALKQERDLDETHTLLNIFFRRYYRFSIVCEIEVFPPVSERVIVRESNGRTTLGVIAEVDSRLFRLKLVNAYLLEVAGLTGDSRPIYGRMMKLYGVVDIPAELVVDWERADDSRILNSGQT